MRCSSARSGCSAASTTSRSKPPDKWDSHSARRFSSAVEDRSVCPATKSLKEYLVTTSMRSIGINPLPVTTTLAPNGTKCVFYPKSKRVARAGVDGAAVRGEAGALVPDGHVAVRAAGPPETVAAHRAAGAVWGA